MGGLGGFKNMLKSWRINLKRKKKKSKIKPFLYSFLTVIISPIFLFTSKNDKNKTIKKIDNTILKNNKYKTENKEYKEKKKSTKKEEINITSKKANLNDTLAFSNRPKYDTKIYNKSNGKSTVSKSFNKVKNNIQAVGLQIFKGETKAINPTIPYESRAINIKKRPINYNFSHDIENNNLLTNNITVNKISNSKKQPINFSHSQDTKKKKNNKSSNNNIIENKKIKIKKESIKPLVFDFKLIEDYNEKLEKIYKDVCKFEKYNESYQISYKIKEIQEKIEILKKEYDNNNLTFKDNLSFDNVKELEEFVNELNNNLEEKKTNLLKFKESDKKEKNKEICNEKNKENDKKEIRAKKELTELELCSKSVIENINKCNKIYNDYLKEIKRNNKKGSLFKYMNIIASSALCFILEIIPFRFVKNTFLRKYIYAINTNNSIRLMNKIINPLDTNNYYLLLSEYEDIKDIIENTYSVMNDSLERIQKIKEYLIQLDVENIDVNLYNKIVNMETVITENIKQMNEKNRNLDKIYVKIKNGNN